MLFESESFFSNTLAGGYAIDRVRLRHRYSETLAGGYAIDTVYRSMVRVFRNIQRYYDTDRWRHSTILVSNTFDTRKSRVCSETSE